MKKKKNVTYHSCTKKENLGNKMLTVQIYLEFCNKYYVKKLK